MTGHTFDVDVWRCECRLCDSVGVYGGGSLSPRPVLCYWGPYQWGSVHRFKGPPSPRDQFILILGAQVCNNLIKGQQLFQATDMIGSLKMDQHHILVHWVILTQFFPYYANLKIFFRDFWGNSCLRFNKDIKFHPYKKHHLLRQQLKEKKINNKTKDISSSFLLDCINSEIFGHFIQIIKNTQSYGQSNINRGQISMCVGQVLCVCTVSVV